MDPRGWIKLKIQGAKVIVTLGLGLALMAGCAGTLPAPSGDLIETRPILKTQKVKPNQQRIKTPAVLQTCAAMPNKQLQEYRGCYATYFFGMDIGINVTGTSTPGISVRFNGIVPDGSAVPVASPGGNQVAFNDGQVAFNAGIGSTSLGSGVFQVVQVAGNNNLVISNMNININIANASSLATKINAINFSGPR
jgi:hypothetical protein